MDTGHTHTQKNITYSRNYKTRLNNVKRLQAHDIEIQVFIMYIHISVDCNGTGLGDGHGLGDGWKLGDG